MGAHKVRVEQTIVRRSEAPCRAGAALAALGIALILGAALARAQDAERIEVVVMVSQISNKPGAVDPRARDLHAKLRDQLRYESLRVLQQRRLDLAMNQLGHVELPDGRSLELRPLNWDERGVLMAVSVEDTVETDMRLPNRHLVVIGGDSYGDGKLVISLEARY